MAIDYRTAAALSQNIAGIGDMFMQINDPANRAKAALVGNQNALLASQVEGQNIDNYYAPGKNTASIFATNANGAQSLAGGRRYDAETANWNIRNQAGEDLRQDLTVYSTGRDAGGRDEMQDSWTNKGYTATGENLSPGVVAVGSRDQLGAVYQDQNGRSYIAADLHGNKNKSVVDIYQEGRNYNPNSVQGLQLRKVGQEKIPYGTTPAQLAEMRAKYERQAGLSNLFNGGGAADLATGTAQMAALTAPDEIAARRALLAQGKVMGKGEYFEPGLSTAFQARDLTNNLDQERLEQGGAMEREVVSEDGLNRRELFKAVAAGTGLRSAGTGGKFDPYAGAKEIGGAAAARFALDGENIGQAEIQKSQAWRASVATLTGMNVPFEVAKAYADAHHGLPTTEDGMLSSPRQTYNSFNPNSITPEQAAQLAAKYTGGGSDMERIINAAQIFDYGAQKQPLAAAAPSAEQPLPVTIASPADPVPQTGVEKPAPKASDEFKRKQSSDEAKAEKTKTSDITKLEGRIKELTGMLKSGNATVSQPTVSGGLGGAYGAGTTRSVAISNDAYNARLAELQKLEGELAKLKSPAQTASQGGVQITGIRLKQ